jgi:hypothetical protein
MRAPGALCYVWTNQEPPGTRTCSAYTSRARMIVLRDVDGGVGDWAAVDNTHASLSTSCARLTPGFTRSNPLSCNTNVVEPRDPITLTSDPPVPGLFTA